MSARKDLINPRIQFLVDCYFGEAQFDQLKAARMACYKSASGYVSKLFQRDDVKRAIAQREAENRERFHINEDSIMQELAKIGFTSMGDMALIGFTPDGDLDLTKLTKAQRAAISSVKTKVRKEKVFDEATGDYITQPIREVEIKLWDKVGALVNLGKHIGMFKERVEITAEEDVIAALNAGRRRMSQPEEAPLVKPATKH